MNATAVSPAIRRRNLALGLALTALYVALVALFFIIFTHKGLPKDPTELRREQAQQQSTLDQGAGKHTAP